MSKDSPRTEELLHGEDDGDVLEIRFRPLPSKDQPPTPRLTEASGHGAYCERCKAYVTLDDRGRCPEGHKAVQH